MVIETTPSSVSPRPRRASAPVPPASLPLHKRSVDGEQQEANGGPTLEQCLVLPPGLALKVDGLLSQPLSELGEGPESEGGIGDSGGGGEGLDQAIREQREEGGLQAESGEGGLRGGDDRAIISSFTFEVGSVVVIWYLRCL